MLPITVSIDAAQTRIVRDRASTLITGEDWGRRFVSNVYIEPVTKTAMLMPLPYSSTWSTSGSGDYRRYTKADYTLTSANWTDDPQTGADASNPYENYINGIAANGDNSEVVTTKVIQPANGAMYLSWFGANAGSDDMVQMECGWGSAGSAPISLRFYAGGKVEVWRNGSYENTYTINASEQTTNPQQTANQFVTVTIHPFRRREILVISNRGGGFTHLFEDIDPYASDPVITPNAAFWWRVPTGAAKVACAPCKFATSGYVTGVKSYFAVALTTAQATKNVAYYDANGGGAVAKLVQPDDPTALWTPNGTDTITRVRIDLTGNGTRTPNVYGAMCAFKTLTAQTPDSPTVLDPYITKMGLEVPDNASDLRWTLELKQPSALATAGAYGISTISNRPISISLGSIAITKGVTEAPKLKIGLDDTHSRVSLEIRDKTKLLEHYLFTDPTPLDGLNIVDAFKLILNSAGIPDTLLDLEATAYTLPKSDTPNTHDGFAVLINAGDTALDWLNRLHENYCANWFMGWVPTASGWKFRLVSPSNLSTTPAMTLYSKVADAIATGVAKADLSDHIGYTYRSYDDQPLEPEANDIWVVGRDLRTGKPIIGHKADTASQDPTTAVNARPANWLGEVRKYGLYDATICDQSAIDQAVSVMYDRLTAQRVVAEFTSEFLIKSDGTPLWRGDVITLDGLGDYRIKSFSTECHLEPDNSKAYTSYWRPTKYVAEKIDSQIGVNQFSGFSLAQVIAAHELKLLSKSVVRADDTSKGLVKQKPLKVTVY